MGETIDPINYAADTVEHLWTKTPPWDCPRCGAVNLAVRDLCRICRWDSAVVSEGMMLTGVEGRRS
jgi:hypothetical protein